jgi:hypothetical protein
MVNLADLEPRPAPAPRLLRVPAPNLRLVIEASLADSASGETQANDECLNSAVAGSRRKLSRKAYLGVTMGLIGYPLEEYANGELPPGVW